MRRSYIRRLALLGAAGGALCAGQALAAVKLSNDFDGNYFSPTEDGRGVSVDYVPRADGSGTFFAAIFTFDDEGNPTWLVLDSDWLEHQHARDDVNVSRVTGGAFGFPFPSDIEVEPVGTATVRANSCTSLDFELDMDAGSGFSDVQLTDLQPVGGPAPTCVYESAFEGCPGFADSVPGFERTCALSGVIRNQDITLTNDTTWLLDGLVRVGDDNANSATLRVEPGTVLIGGGGTADYLYISPGSKIFANGLAHAPIVLTSDQDGFIDGTTPAPGDLGGLVISGNAPSNACPDAPFNCFSEFDSTQRFGGDDPNDSSGAVTYMQVRYAGIEFQPDSEVNSFTFQGVGGGTVLSHLQAFRGQDDGFEWFGGTVNAKHLIVTEGGDDALDHDLGFSGKVQYALVVHGAGFGEDHGIEGAGNPDNFSAEPLTTVVYSNLTFIGNGQGGDGVRLKEGSAGQVWNSVITGFPASCINMTNGATYDHAGTPASPTGNTVFSGVIVDCDQDFKQDGDAPYTTQSFFNAFPGNAATDPRLDGYVPRANSPARTAGQRIPDDDFFDFTPYRGAFDGNHDWTVPWAYQVLGGAD